MSRASDKTSAADETVAQTTDPEQLKFARQVAQEFRRKIEQKDRRSNIFEVLKGSRTERMVEIIERKKQQEMEIKDFVVSLESLPDDDKKQAIDAFVTQLETKGEIHSANLLNIMSIYKLCGEDEAVIQMYESSKNKTFQKNAASMEMYCEALNNRAEQLLSSEPELAHSLTDSVRRTVAAKRILDARNAGSPTAHWIEREAARAFEITAKASSNPAIQKRQTELALEYFSKGAKIDSSCGIHKIRMLLEQSGNVVTDEIKTQAIKAYHVAKSNGMDETDNSKIVLNGVLAACISGENKLIQEAIEILQQSKVSQDEIAKFRVKHAGFVEGAFQDYYGNHPARDPLSVDEMFQRSTYDYRSALLGDRLTGGNLQFGGELTQQLICREGVSIFSKILNEPMHTILPSVDQLHQMLDDPTVTSEIREKLNQLIEKYSKPPASDYLDPSKNMTLHDIDNPKEFIDTLQDVVRAKFNTYVNCIEEPHQHCKIPYRDLDYLMKAFNRDLGLSKQAMKHAGYNSSTSLAAMYLLGIGDCRHHAESTQILFDLWKRDKLQEHIEGEDFDAASNLENYRLRVIDCEKKIGDINAGHTYNILQVRSDAGASTYTVVDSFHPQVDEQQLQLTVIPKDPSSRWSHDKLSMVVQENTTRLEGNKAVSKKEDTVFTSAPYAGDKGRGAFLNDGLHIHGYDNIHLSYEQARALYSTSDHGAAFNERVREMLRERIQTEKMHSIEMASPMEIIRMSVVGGVLPEYQDIETIPKDDFMNALGFVSAIFQDPNTKRSKEMLEAVFPDLVEDRAHGNFKWQAGEMKQLSGHHNKEEIKIMLEQAAIALCQHKSEFVNKLSQLPEAKPSSKEMEQIYAKAILRKHVAQAQLSEPAQMQRVAAKGKRDSVLSQEQMKDAARFSDSMILKCQGVLDQALTKGGSSSKRKVVFHQSADVVGNARTQKNDLIEKCISLLNQMNIKIDSNTLTLADLEGFSAQFDTIYAQMIQINMDAQSTTNTGPYIDITREIVGRLEEKIEAVKEAKIEAESRRRPG